HHRRRRFLLHQLRVVNLACGIVENHDQVVPALILKPLVPAAVDMQQHPRQRPPLAPSRHQARSLQRLLHPGVTQLDPVLGLQLLVKMLHVQIEIFFSIQREHLLYRRHRHPATRRLAPPPVQQPVVALFHVALPPPPHVPVADPKDLRRLPPRDLLRHRLQHYVLYFHRPLHRGPRISFHASHGLLSSPPAKRTYHVLSQPDISCATDTTSTRGWYMRKILVMLRRDSFKWLPAVPPISLYTGSTRSSLAWNKTNCCGSRSTYSGQVQSVCAFERELMNT